MNQGEWTRTAGSWSSFLLAWEPVMTKLTCLQLQIRDNDWWKQSTQAVGVRSASLAFTQQMVCPAQESCWGPRGTSMTAGPPLPVNILLVVNAQDKTEKRREVSGKGRNYLQTLRKINKISNISQFLQFPLTTPSCRSEQNTHTHQCCILRMEANR